MTTFFIVTYKSTEKIVDPTNQRPPPSHHLISIVTFTYIELFLRGSFLLVSNKIGRVWGVEPLNHFYFLSRQKYRKDYPYKSRTWWGEGGWHVIVPFINITYLTLLVRICLFKKMGSTVFGKWIHSNNFCLFYHTF